MGLFDYILEKALKLPPALLYRHECVDLAADALPSLPPGTPVFCHLTLNVAEHSGICIGDRIVHLDGAGQVISSTPQEFLARLDGTNLAVSIYYAAEGRNKPLANADVAIRALEAIGAHRNYRMLSDNCHGFTIRCLTGQSTCRAAWSLRTVENTISSVFGTDDWRWRRWGGWKYKTQP
ncbi:MAG: hypothetical protein J6866_05355 [Victivallales bacterium]|nr:hypothetical protein [Victivallales bacterium]